MYRLSLKRPFGSRGPAGTGRVSMVVGATILKLALGATQRAASLSRCCRVGSADRRSRDFTICDGEASGAQKRVATLTVNEQMASAIRTLCHLRSTAL